MSAIDLPAANARIRSCVHCGFCTATCPTYLETGDELDSPRGRIWLMKDMLANPGEAPSARAVYHIDRCLSCLSCTTTCPSGVDYMHLIDATRTHIETSYRRPLPDRLLRAGLPAILTRRWLFRAMLRAGRLARPLAPWLPARLQAMLAMVPDMVPPAGLAELGRPTPVAAPAGRVILHLGCVQPVLRPQIDDAAIRLLARHGYEVIVTRQSACCGALDHHLGRAGPAAAHARANIIAWENAGPVAAIIITASGCGTVIKDYPALFGDDPAMKVRADAIASKARDISEFIAQLPPLPAVLAPAMLIGAPAIAWHSACSLQHGQQVKDAPRKLLEAAGFDVRVPAEGHICCGSAGSYAILQPEMSAALRNRKQAALLATGASIVASSNIGCLGHIANSELHTVHLVELLDWASGGPVPAGIAPRMC